jgi:hypothetical protein
MSGIDLQARLIADGYRTPIIFVGIPRPMAVSYRAISSNMARPPSG